MERYIAVASSTWPLWGSVRLVRLPIIRQVSQARLSSGFWRPPSWTARDRHGFQSNPRPRRFPQEPAGRVPTAQGWLRCDWQGSLPDGFVDEGEEGRWPKKSALLEEHRERTQTYHQAAQVFREPSRIVGHGQYGAADGVVVARHRAGLVEGEFAVDQGLVHGDFRVADLRLAPSSTWTVLANEASPMPPGFTLALNSTNRSEKPKGSVS